MARCCRRQPGWPPRPQGQPEWSPRQDGCPLTKDGLEGGPAPEDGRHVTQDGHPAVQDGPLPALTPLVGPRPPSSAARSIEPAPRPVGSDR